MRFWKFGLFLLFCSLFGLQGCTGAEDKPAQKPDISFTPSEIQKFHFCIITIAMSLSWNGTGIKSSAPCAP